jgi:multidrug efflux system membrane fusion protein
MSSGRFKSLKMIRNRKREDAGFVLTVMLSEATHQSEGSPEDHCRKLTVCPTMPSNRRAYATVLAIAAAGVMFLSSCTRQQPKQLVPPAPVTVSQVLQKDMPVLIRAIGNIQPCSTVSVKSMINGQIVKINFKEGQDVRKGDLLFVIDQAPYEGALAQAQAQLAKDEALEKQAVANTARDAAQANNAKVQADRYGSLINQGIVTHEQYDQMRTTADSTAATVDADRATAESARAAIRADKATINNARVQLGYTTITSPIDGKVGSILIYPGNVVKANDTVSLVVINQITPIYASFSVPQANLANIKRYMSNGQLKVEAIIDKNDQNRRSGTLTFIDNAVDQTTGTIQLKATFTNQDKALWPGQFVDVVLTLTTQVAAIVAPARSIQVGQSGQYVYVVKQDNTVESRPVVLGNSNDVEAVIDKGLEAGETVVTDGQLRLFPGAHVEVKNGTASAMTRETPQ